jgi:predicted nucleic acid-binding protein
LREVVLDASVAVRALAPVDDAGFALQARLLAERCVAPHLVDAEVGHVLRRRVAAGDIEASSAEAALMALNALVVERYPHGTLARAAWGLRDNFSYARRHVREETLFFTGPRVEPGDLVATLP